jgi:biotin operon repressor
MTKEKILDLLWEGPKSLSELTRLTGLTRQAVIKKLKKMIMEGDVVKEEGKRGRYLLTTKGMSEYFDRRENKLLYNFDILPKLSLPLISPDCNLEDLIQETRFLDLPAPISYKARMYVSSDLEEELQYQRSFVSFRDRVRVRPEDTLREFTAGFVNKIVWSILLERLVSCIQNDKSMDELDGFHIRLTIDVLFKPNKNVLKRAAALLSLYLIDHYFEISTVTAFDIIRYLEQVDENLKGLASLVEKASIVEVEKIETEDESKNWREVRIITKHKDKDKSKTERLEAIKILLDKILEILRSEGQIDKRTFTVIKKIINKRVSKYGQIQEEEHEFEIDEDN